MEYSSTTEYCIICTMLSFIDTLDLIVLVGLYKMHTAGLISFFSQFTNFGSIKIIGVLAVLLAAYLLWRHKRAQIAGLATTLIGSAVVIFGLKVLIKHGRPDALHAAIHETGYSFPSGHAGMSAAFYGYVIFLVSQSKLSRNARLFVILALGVWILAIGFSRIYLGVHLLSEVLGGYLVGWIFCLDRGQSQSAPTKRTI